MLLLLFNGGTPVTYNDTYIYCSTAAPSADVLDTVVDGVLVRRMTSG